MDWRNDQSNESRRLIWLTGDPGPGKSAVTASIARACKDDKTLWAQFFINRNKAETINPRLFFPSIARQTHRPLLPHRCRDRDLHGSPKSTLTHGWYFKHTCISALRECSRIVCRSDLDKPVVIVIDGLDETDQSKLADTAKIFSQIFTSKSSRNTKVFISSRTDEDIRRPFSKMMDPRHVKHMHLDIAAASSIRHVSDSMATRIKCIVVENDLNWNRWPGEVRLQAVCNRAAGLFIWAATVVKFFQVTLP